MYDEDAHHAATIHFRICEAGNEFVRAHNLRVLNDVPPSWAIRETSAPLTVTGKSRAGGRGTCNLLTGDVLQCDYD